MKHADGRTDVRSRYPRCRDAQHSYWWCRRTCHSDTESITYINVCLLIIWLIQHYKLSTYIHPSHALLHVSVGNYGRKRVAQPHVKGKGKAVPLQAWTGPEGSRKLRFPDFMTTAKDGGKVVSLTHRPPLPARKYSWYSFLLEAESTPGP